LGHPDKHVRLPAGFNPIGVVDMPRRQSFWSNFNAVLGCVAAVVTAITGLYLAFKTSSNSAPPSSPVVASNIMPAGVPLDASAGVTYDRTPWLGIELRQNDQPLRLRSTSDNWDQFEAALNSGPFEITITRHADDPGIGVYAWQDRTLFDAVRNDKLELRGTGIAGAQFAIPIVYLDKEAFNYYDTERMKRIADDKYSIFISSVGSREVELPLPRFSGPLHLIVFRVPKDMDRTVARQDFELFTLHRP
jgi:hypothetical protein